MSICRFPALSNTSWHWLAKARQNDKQIIDPCTFLRHLWRTAIAGWPNCSVITASRARKWPRRLNLSMTLDSDFGPARQGALPPSVGVLGMVWSNQGKAIGPFDAFLNAGLFDRPPEKKSRRGDPRRL